MLNQEELQSLYETFKVLYETKLTLGQFYGKCAEKLDRDRDFWQYLADGETAHSQILVKVAGLISDNPGIAGEGKKIGVDAAKGFIRAVRFKLEQLDWGGVAREEALQMARNFEKVLIDNNYASLIVTENQEINENLELLDRETRLHLGMIEEKIKEGRRRGARQPEKAQEAPGEAAQVETIQERDMFRAVFSSIADAVYFTDPERRIISWNQAAERLTGYTEEEVKGKECSLILNHRDCKGTALCADRCPLTKAMSGGDEYFLEEVWLTTKNGMKKPVEVSCSAVVGDNGKVLGAVEVFRDRTRQRELEKLKEEFFSTITHDLKAPLASIIGFTDLIQDPRFGEISPQKLEFLQSIRQSGEMLSHLISNIVDASRIEAGQMSFNFESVSLNGLIQETLNLFKPIAMKNNILMEESCPGNAWVQVDGERIRRVLNNLVINAIRFTPAGGKVSIAAEPSGEWIMVTVADTGKGIARENQEKIFHKFAQANGESGGAGLGLYIVKNLLQGHGSDIHIYSTPGEGSRFSFYLPRSATPPREATLESVKQKGKILIVSKSDDAVEPARLILQGDEHQIEIVRNGMEALYKALAMQPDVIIINPPLPDLSIEDFIQSLRFSIETRHIPLAILSTECRTGWKETGVEVIPTPVEKTYLRAVIGRVLDK